MPLDRALDVARRAGSRVLGAATPVGARQERQRLVDALARGAAAPPRWTYAPLDVAAARGALDEARALWAPLASAGPLAALLAVYHARIQELSLDTALVEAAGSAAFGALAARRYGGGDAAVAAEAAALAEAWIAEAEDGDDDRDGSGAFVTSDGDEPSSLASRMRRAVGAHRLPFRVVVHADLSPLAATGDGVVLVAKGRRMGPRVADRTVLHEVEAHALPRARALGRRPGIFRIGTARGAEDQEGCALLIEERAGFLDGGRRRELAARHLACAWMEQGADFVEVARRLHETHGLRCDDAVTIAERVFRGSDGRRRGLGRERAYLEAFVRVQRHLAACPEDGTVLLSGQVSTDAAPTLRPFARTPICHASFSE